MTLMSVRPFADRMKPALKGKGFMMEDYWVWCGSVVKESDRYYMFASRWPKTYPFYQGYLAASEIVIASSATPQGPYEFEKVLFSDRGEQYWDGRCVHNPFIVKQDGQLLLFYIGAHYPGPKKTPEEMWAMNRGKDKGNGIFPEWFGTIRIGVATADSVLGEWTRPDLPTFDNNPDGWDQGIVTNPTPCPMPDGSILLYYRSSGAKLGLASMAEPGADLTRLVSEPVVDLGEGVKVEDPFVFWNGSCFEMVCKDLTGKITDEFHAAVHLISEDGIDWKLTEQPKAWSRTVLWDDGTTTTQGSIERPFILFEEGEPAYLFAATADGPGNKDGRPGHYWAENTWNMVIPLR